MAIPASIPAPAPDAADCCEGSCEECDTHDYYEEGDIVFSANPIVTLVRSKGGDEMALSELWAHHRVFDSLGLEFLYVDGFHLSLPADPLDYAPRERDLATRAVGGGLFWQHPHVGVRRWTFSKICLGDAFDRCPGECHKAWNALGLTSRVRTCDPLGGVISVRGYDAADRLAIEVMIPPPFVWWYGSDEED